MNHLVAASVRPRNQTFRTTPPIWRAFSELLISAPYNSEGVRDADADADADADTNQPPRHEFRHGRCFQSTSQHCGGSLPWNSSIGSFALSHQTQLPSMIAGLDPSQRRNMSSWLPEAMQGITIWGGAGWMIKTLHMDGAIPFWACFAISNFMVRSSLLPLVVYGAKSAAAFSKVAPEIQFIATLFRNDLKRMQAEGRSLYERRILFQTNLKTVKDIYKLHGIHPMSVFFSPLIQIPIFYYISVDLRKIINGGDPALAQQLIESPFMWIPDLTEPDPWYGVPIAAGLMLYANIEVATGRKSLVGPSAYKSDFGLLIKDLFQSLAVFMPAFMSQSPAGMQIYLFSSFTFTLFQSAALRTGAIRRAVGLPPIGAPPIEPKYAKQFLEFKKLELKAQKLRGDGPVLGRNVMAVGFEVSFAGTNRPTTIKGSGHKIEDLPPVPVIGGEARVILTGNRAEAIRKNRFKLDIGETGALGGGPFIHGISAPIEQLEEQFAEQLEKMDTKSDEQKPEEQTEEDSRITSFSRMADPSLSPEELMEAANKGVIFAPPIDKDKSEPAKLSSKRLSHKKKMGGKGQGKSKRRR